MPPRKCAEYELYRRIKLLGEGSFGKAYLVECLKDKYIIYIERFRTLWVAKYMDMTAMTQAEKEETVREAKILEFLQHPNIVKFKEVYATRKGKLCVIMEYADGMVSCHVFFRRRLSTQNKRGQGELHIRDADFRLVHLNLLGPQTRP